MCALVSMTPDELMITPLPDTDESWVVQKILTNAVRVSIVGEFDGDMAFFAFADTVAGDGAVDPRSITNAASNEERACIVIVLVTVLVRDKGIEPLTSVWKTDVLPLN